MKKEGLTKSSKRSGTIRDRDRYETYRSFKTIFHKEEYIQNSDSYCFRVAISQLRFNVLPLNNNVHRYSENVQDKVCPFCEIGEEDEEHFLFECFLYNDLRVKFLSECINLPLCELLKSENSMQRYNLSRYIFHAINKRKRMLSE